VILEHGNAKDAGHSGHGVRMAYRMAYRMVYYGKRKCVDGTLKKHCIWGPVNEYTYAYTTHDSSRSPPFKIRNLQKIYTTFCIILTRGTRYSAID
jgi:hypothetical protein